MVPSLYWFATGAGAIFRGDVFVVVFAQERVSCSTLDETAVCVAGCEDEMLARFQGWRKSVCLEEGTGALKLFVPLCCPGLNKVMAGLGFLIGERDGWVVHCDLCCCFG